MWVFKVLHVLRLSHFTAESAEKISSWQISEYSHPSLKKTEMTPLL